MQQSITTIKTKLDRIEKGAQLETKGRGGEKEEEEERRREGNKYINKTIIKIESLV